MYWNLIEKIQQHTPTRLTLTWDVLKSIKSCNHRYWLYWLTLTWDVLKWESLGRGFRSCQD